MNNTNLSESLPIAVGYPLGRGVHTTVEDPPAPAYTRRRVAFDLTTTVIDGDRITVNTNDVRKLKIRKRNGEYIERELGELHKTPQSESSELVKSTPPRLDQGVQAGPEVRVLITTRDMAKAQYAFEAGIICHLLVGIVQWVYDWWMSGRVSHEEQQEGVDAIACRDEDQVEDSTHYNQLMDEAIDVTRVRRRCAAHLADACVDAIPGVTENTVANQLVARRWMQNHMVSTDVRLAHRKAIIEDALFFVRTPNKYVVEAARLAATTASVIRTREGEMEYHSRGRRSIFHWFGKKYSRPKPRRT
jgi:hypothetical protein